MKQHFPQQNKSFLFDLREWCGTSINVKLACTEYMAITVLWVLPLGGYVTYYIRQSGYIDL